MLFAGSGGGQIKPIVRKINENKKQEDKNADEHISDTDRCNLSTAADSSHCKSGSCKHGNEGKKGKKGICSTFEQLQSGVLQSKVRTYLSRKRQRMVSFYADAQEEVKHNPAYILMPELHKYTIPEAAEHLRECIAKYKTLHYNYHISYLP